MAYQDKAPEELRSILENFKKSYRSKYGQEFNRKQFKHLVEKLLNEKRTNEFLATFGTLSTNNVAQLIELIDADAKSKG